MPTTPFAGRRFELPYTVMKELTNSLQTQGSNAFIITDDQNLCPKLYAIATFDAPRAREWIDIANSRYVSIFDIFLSNVSRESSLFVESTPKPTEYGSSFDPDILASQNESAQTTIIPSHQSTPSQTLAPAAQAIDPNQSLTASSQPIQIYKRRRTGALGKARDRTKPPLVKGPTKSTALIDEADMEEDAAIEADRIARLYRERRLEGIDLQMHENAMAIGHGDTILNWKEITSKTLGVLALQSAKDLVETRDTMANLQLAYERVRISNISGHVWQASRRIGLANLHEAYTCALDALHYTPPSHGQSAVSQKKRELFAKICPSVVDTNDYEQEYRRFNRHLQKAAVWFSIRERLGPGTICLFPYSQISDTWVTETLTKGKLRVWLRLIEMENPECITDGESLWPNIQQSLGTARAGARQSLLQASVIIHE